MPSSLRADRAGFYAFLGLAFLVIAMGIYMLFSGGSSSQAVQTASESTDVPLVQTFVQAIPPVAVDAAPEVPPSSFVAATPVPTPDPEAVAAAEAAAAEAEAEAEAAAAAAAAAESSSSSDSGSSDSGASSEGTTQTASAGAGTPELDPPTLSGGQARAVSAAASFTYVAFATQSGAQPIFSDSSCATQTQVTYQYLDGSVVNYPMHNPTYFGNTLALRVIGDASGDCIKVQLPTRPNGQTGYIQTANWDIGSSDWYVQINTGNNTVAVWKGENLRYETSAVTGASGTPTPRVTAFVDEKMAGPSGAYGPWLLSLGVFSNAHNTFGGGLPKVALHGTNNPGLMGQYASNGCIRVENDAITWIYNNVPVGTYVAII